MRITNRFLLLSGKQKALLLCWVFCFAWSLPTAFSQGQRIVSGVVRNANGPLEGALVTIKGSIARTTTDATGQYRIQANVGDTLLFRNIGYVEKQQVVGKDRWITIDVLLVASATALDEVVVIGYGTANRSELTGSIAEVNMADLQLAPVASVSEALAGRLAGVQVSGNDGQPGSQPNIVIRGAGSLTQNTGPLYVIDGLPVEDFNLGSLNPIDIKSVTVLKDASATAIYGARGANGVIVIETKTGKGKTVVSLNSSLGMQDAQKTIDVMAPYEFVKYQQEFNPTYADAVYFSDGKGLESYRNEPGIDWQREVISSSPVYINQLSVSGGSAQTQFSISGSAYNQNGIILNTGHTRYQGRASINHTISERFKTGATINYSSVDTYGQTVSGNSTGTGATFTTNLMFRTWGYRPVSGNDDIDLANELADPDNNNANDIRFNPVISSENDYTKRFRTDVVANAFLSFQIADGLELKSIVSGNTYSLRTELFYNTLTPQGSPLNYANARGIHGSILQNMVNTLSNENFITFKREINNIHSITAMGGFSAQSRKLQNFGFSSNNIDNEKLGISGLDQGEANTPVSASSSNALVSAFGRIVYAYQSKFFFAGTLRRDGSSKFAPGNRWGTFPSVGLSYNLHREEFFKNIPIVSYAKLRASYGVTGNNRVSDFVYLPAVSSSLGRAYSFNNNIPTMGAGPDNLVNEGLRWESTAQTNLGLDVNLLKNRVRIIADVYQKVTSDLLLNAQLPRSVGFTSSFQNIGKLRNKGLEFTITTNNISKQNFEWETSFNISFNKNEILELVQSQERWYSNVSFNNNYSRPLYVAEIGQPAGRFYGFMFDGVYQYEDFDNPSPDVYVLKEGIPTYGSQVQPGSIKYRDIDGNGLITDDDQTVIGRGQPIHTGGFTNNFRYKNFDLNLFLQWSYGNDLLNANRLIFEGNVLSTPGLNQFAGYADRWTPANPSNTLFRTNGGGPPGYYSSRVIEDGSYLRVKTVSFGYQLPNSMISKLSLSSLRFSFSAQNLFTFTNYSGMDPEVSVRNTVLTPGFDFSAYPQPRTLVFGLNAAF